MGGEGEKRKQMFPLVLAVMAANTADVPLLLFMTVKNEAQE